jgi:cold shock CspA family protein
MARRGTLKSWKAERGFGFIAPDDGGPDIFVHISSFPRGGGQPTVGEELFFDLGRGRGGQIQAVRVHRKGEADNTASRSRPPLAVRGGRLSSILIIAGVLAVVGINSFQKRQEQPERAGLTQSSDLEEPARPRAADSRCDGRTRCTEMRSCSEARFFLRNCPGVQMDGDGDGVPCEEQWCGGSR